MSLVAIVPMRYSMFESASIGMISGAALVGFAGIRAVGELRGFVQRREQEVEVADKRRASFVNKLDAALRWARATQPALKAWTGTRPFRVTAVVDEAQACRSFYLAPEDGRPLARFEPGQYLTFHLPSTDPMRPIVRCYSLSERPREDYFRVTVKDIGRGSGLLHREVRPGTVLHAEAPQGTFFLDPTDDSPLVLIGAGIGVTPIVSMASALAHRGDARSVYLFAGFRNSREHLFRSRLADLAEASANMRLDVSYSRPMATDLAGRDFGHLGHVDIARLRQVLPSSNLRYYICGPAAMMGSLVPALLEWGVPASHIHYEAFGPASVNQLAATHGAAPCEVTFARSGRSLRWSGGELSLLELADQGGVALESGCRAGNCGQCRVMLAAGRVKHVKPPGVQLVDGECLACIARPDGDVVIEA